MIGDALYIGTKDKRLACQRDLNVLLIIWPYYLLRMLCAWGKTKRVGEIRHPYHKQIAQKHEKLVY